MGTHSEPPLSVEDPLTSPDVGNSTTTNSKPFGKVFITLSIKEAPYLMDVFRCEFGMFLGGFGGLSQPPQFDDFSPIAEAGIIRPVFVAVEPSLPCSDLLIHSMLCEGLAL